jgi:hypothetical protein
MKRYARIISITLLLVISPTLIGCGGGGSTTPSSSGSSPADTAQVIQGKWTIRSTSTQGQSNTITLINFTDQGGGNFFAPSAIICTLSPSVVCKGSLVGQELLILQGTATAAGAVNMTLVIQQGSDSASACTIAITGTVSGSTMRGTYTGCQDGGSFTGTENASATGTYAGSFNSTVNPSPIAIGFTAGITEAANFTLTGSATLTNSVCFTNLTFGSPSTAIGEGLFLQDAAHGIYAVALPSEPGTDLAYVVNATQSCGADQGQGQIAKH